jgi:membrane protein implicated in regulation of membrane protease activity
VTVDPSSLIFVVIVAIWAAYLLGHWVRRRDHLATVRSVDRFSEAMRVLERRPAVRAVPLSRPNPRSYVVAPASRPASEVTVKRAPAVARPDRPSRPVAGPVSATANETVKAPASAPGSRPAARKPANRKPANRKPANRKPAIPGLLLLVLLVGTPVVWVLVPLTALSWVTGLVVTAALVANLAYLRHAVRRRRDQQRRRARQELRSASQARRQSRRDVVGQVVAANRTRAGVQADVAPQEQDESAAPAVDDGSWRPVPVPPPTYTLKPKAPAPAARRPVAEPAATIEAPAAAEAAATIEAPATAEAAIPVAPAVAPAAAGFDLDEILERRIAANG